MNCKVCKSGLTRYNDSTTAAAATAVAVAAVEDLRDFFMCK